MAYFQRDVQLLLLPADVVVELLREELQVDGVLDESDDVQL